MTRFPHYRGAVAALGAAAAIACDPPGRAVPDPVLLPAATDSVDVPLEVVASAAWLGPGRWVVVAPDEGAVRLVQLGATDSVSEFGEAGAFQHPHFVFTDQDTAYVGDWGRRRVTVWGPDQSPT